MMKFLRRCFGLVSIGCVLLLACAAARGAEPEEVYLPIFTLIQQGDFLKTQGHPDMALAKYDEAIKQIRKFQINYPTFNVRMLAYRSNDVAQKIAGLNSGSGTETGAGSATSGAGKSPTTGSSGGAGPSGSSVKLLQPGGEPRKALRFHPKQGDKNTAMMTVKMAVAMNMGGAEMPPMKLPAINITMDTTVDSVKPDGDIQYTVVLSDISVAQEAEAATAAAGDALKNAFSGLKGSSGSATMSSRGFSKTLDLKVPAGADPQVTSMMSQMKETIAHLITPFPEQPVGPGAKWEVKMPIKAQGMSMNRTTTAELVSVEEDKITTKNAIVETAPAQKIESPAMPGMKIDLVKMNGSGSGEVTVNLGQIVPAAGSVESRSEMSMAMNQGAQKQTMDMKVDMSMKVESK